MHLQIYVRGIYSQVELWKSMAQGVFFKWRRTNLKTGKEEIILVQGALRPSVLGTYEYVFPETALPEVLCIMGLAEGSIGCKKTMKKKIQLAGLRKMLGVKKIPKSIYEEAKKLPESIVLKDSERGLSSLKVPGVAIHLIGIKKDDYREFTEFGYYQEAL